MKLLGIDGCRGGWVVGLAQSDSNCLRFEVVADIRAIVKEAGSAALLVAIDVPIGLPSGSTPRACDLEARRALGKGQGSRVFPAPTRQSLEGVTYAKCCELNAEASGKRLSKQAHAILPKIREVDDAITPDLQTRIREMHPEVTFRVINGTPLQHTKHTTFGLEERVKILQAQGVSFDPTAERRALGPSNVAVNDLLDAAVGIVTLRRLLVGEQRILGDGALDGRGLRMEIVA